jgi:DNA-binding beta-propeller fold protein YncE
MQMRTRRVLLASAVSLSIATGALWGALADDQSKGDDRGQMRGDERLVLKKTLGVGSDASGQPLKLGAFDISFVDPKIELYILADRTNASVDLFDSEQAEFIGRVGTKCPAGNPAPHFCCQGVVLVNGVANNSLSGPDGDVIVDHKEIWAGDGDSRIKVIDIATRQFVTTIDTGGTARVDEMAYDSRDHLLAAANNADTPPFVTVFDTKAKTIVAQLIFSNNPADKCTAPNPVTYQCVHTAVDAQNGIEQPQWSPKTGLFYVSVPQVGKDPTQGGVSIIDPKTNKVTNTFLVANCSPAGLALGPRNEALLGCNTAFPIQPTPPDPNLTQTTRSLIIDLTSNNFSLDGAVVGVVGIGGSDEVWFDAGTRHYFLAADNNLAKNKFAPILGSVDAVTHQLDPSPVSSRTAHSVAADKNSHFVFLPIATPAATTPDPTNPCPSTGCVQVYLAQPEGGDHQVAQRDD